MCCSVPIRTPNSSKTSKRRNDFVLAIAVAMNPTFATLYLCHGVQLQVTSWRQTVSFAAVPTPPVRVVFASGKELVAKNLLNAHPSVGVTRRIAFDVLTECELDTRWSFFHRQITHAAAPSQFDDLVLSADRIGRPVQDVCGGHSAGQLSVDCDVRVIDEVTNANFCCHGLPGFIDAAIGAHVGMAVDQAGSDVLAFDVDDLAVGGHRELFTDFRDHSITDENIDVDDALILTRPNGGSAKQNERSSWQRFIKPIRPEWVQNGVLVSSADLFFG